MDATLETISKRLVSADCVVGFNIKYDLHWIKRAGISAPKRVWDCQAAHFLLTNQRTPYPSLDGVAEYYGIEGKTAGFAEKYWDQGIDTPDIPVEEVVAYNKQDLWVTEQVYHKQKSELEKNEKLYRLFLMDMSDLLVLQEMEYNGLKLNVEKCKQQEQEAKAQIEAIEAELKQRCPNTPINWDSGDDLSAYLYGGTITTIRREPVGVFKTGNKIGQLRFKVIEDKHPLLRLVDPLEGSELKKGTPEAGPWSAAEDVLKQLKKCRQIELLLERAKLSKLLDYLEGFPALIEEKDWPAGEIHGQFNQCVARTGRLSSSNPNLQNLPDQMLKLFETRYECSN